MTAIRVLFAEDDLTTQKAVSHKLGSKGILVTIANNGKEALEIALSTPFHLFLVDLGMPVVSGFEFLKKVKSFHQLAHIPVVILTSDHRDSSVLSCLKFGAADYIVKPFNFNHLYSRILQLTAPLIGQKESSTETVQTHELIRKRFFIIDTDPKDMFATESTLQGFGVPQHQILKTDQIDLVFSILMDNKPDIIIMDPYTPKLEDGLALIGQIRKTFPQKRTPILLSCQFRIPDRYLNILQITHNDYILKPYSPKILFSFLERLSELPVFDKQRLGDYLVEEGHISLDQLNLALMFQNQMSYQRMNVGALALVKGYMTIEEVADLYPLFEIDDCQFLDLATAGNFITREQAMELLDMKKDLSINIGRVLVLLGFLRKDVLASILRKRKGAQDIELNRHALSETTGKKLMDQIKTNHQKEALHLIELGANINFEVEDGSTPLMLASSAGNIDIVKALLEHGAYIDAMNKDRWTALHFAACKGKATIFELLLERGACLGFNDIWGRSVEDVAKEHGHMNIIELLRKSSVKK